MSDSPVIETQQVCRTAEFVQCLDASEVGDLVVGSAQRVAERMGDEFAGFVIVGWNGNGAYRQVAYLNTALHIALDLIPDMVKKAVEGSYG